LLKFHMFDYQFIHNNTIELSLQEHVIVILFLFFGRMSLLFFICYVL
jgi:hypothetical protein